ncbi:tripartite tricarboxylate transporter substrate binding protein [Spartinivicinus ruber]|uniref:tripartite tricarboxylate transporter substrate binding protein n=1 Tax=Spartinivicinus ruber TaxID=2683272 RepID=UPI0013D3F729|nr:tripartite tricarboxylate transporter substrate-binding protein [Spartinivicinus ruber]
MKLGCLTKALFVFITILNINNVFAGISNIDFLIPGGEGGGWDTTARQTGQALIETNLIKSASYNNLSGGGGGRAIKSLVTEPDKYQNTLMVQSTPLILRNLSGVIPHSYRDITPISLLIAEYQVLVVPKDSVYKNTSELIAAVKENYSKNSIIGGSAKGSLDHVTAALILQAAGLNPKKMRYISSDGGGEALERLYKGVGVALVTGFGEIVDEYKKDKVRILGITSESKVPGLEIPTFKEQGLNLVFANWRGFFARSGMSSDQVQQYVDLFKSLNQTDKWNEVRSKYGWADYLKSGDELKVFLKKQENSIQEILKLIE